MLGSRRATWVIVAVGLVARLCAVLLLRHDPLRSDAGDYHALAVALATGRPFSTDWPPGLPLFLVPFYLLFGTGVPVARAAMLVWYGVLSAATYGVAGQLADRRAANLALAVMALFPAHVVQAAMPLTQLPTAALLMTAVWLALRVRAGSGLALLALGPVLGYAVLTRPPALLACVALPLVLLVRSRRVRDAAVPLATGAVVVGLWLVAAQHQAGRFIFINDSNSQNFYYGNNPWTPLYRTWWFGSHKYPEDGVPKAYADAHAAIGRLPPAERDRAFTTAALKHIVARPDLFVVRSLARVRTYFAFDSFVSSFLIKRAGASKWVGLPLLGLDALHYLAIMAAALAWLCARRARPAGDVPLFALVVAFCYSAPYMVSFAHPTYHFPVVPLLAVLGAAHVAHPAPLARRRTFFVAAAALALIQIEWVVVMAARV